MNERPNFNAVEIRLHRGRGLFDFSDVRLPVTAASLRRCAFEPVPSISAKPRSSAEAILIRNAEFRMKGIKRCCVLSRSQRAASGRHSAASGDDGRKIVGYLDDEFHLFDDITARRR